MKITAFKTPKPKRFEYKPLFYNEEAESLQKRKDLIRDLSDKDNPQFDKDTLREELRMRWQASRQKKRSGFMGGSSPALIAAAVALIVLMIYMVLSSGIF
jgi:hypothetical protein